MEENDKGHAVGDSATKLYVLVAGAAKIKKSPQDHSWAKLVKCFDIEDTDARIQLPTNKPLRINTNKR